ncbi:hypothetical protein BU9_CDS0089 [Klebsiella phage Kpn BU9]|nr:hypothetical protein BU9_CDS0089 [Klebsiella phage Kpn BU9]
MRADVDFSQNCDCEVRHVEAFDSTLQPGVSFSALNETDQMASENEASN